MPIQKHSQLPIFFMINYTSQVSTVKLNLSIQVSLTKLKELSKLRANDKKVQAKFFQITNEWVKFNVTVFKS